NYPECRFTRPLAVVEPGDAEAAATYPRALGDDPETGLPVSLRKGPFGFYVQLGEAEDGAKPKRASLPRSYAPEDITLEVALALLALPRMVGRHPETGDEILAG